ncbi:metal-dependent hydrolase [Paenibacillus cremeus]|uniref:Metal-dependent hydrolase n=1 Tax=Paenibacillus cremeus TaxID=2163881 RepID=A0A559KAA9_9BACL|nr:metal-dependent hydrolase [Paenibacillus cremeus]TVY09039.1 metal-dependent hydrolase [Paenibacillus cremeus]
MLQKTHSFAGLLAAEGVVLYLQPSPVSWESAAALLIGCLAGPLADIDKQGSTMAKIFFPLSFLLHLGGIRHRTFTHSFLCLIGLGLLFTSLPPLLYWSFLLAYASHPLIDLLNEQGVELIWPLKLKFRLLPKFMAIGTGSMMETLFRYGLALLTLALPAYYVVHSLPTLPGVLR